MKLQGPMFSLGASGSIGGTVTFATWKGRPYARQLVVPSNPRSAQQTAFRAMFGWLSRAWANLGDPAQQSWQDLADAGNYSLFNAFMRWNQDRWGRFEAPQNQPNATPTAAQNATISSVVAGVRSLTVNISQTADAANFGIVLYRKAGAGPDGVQSEVVAILDKAGAGGTTSYQDNGLTPGVTYYYKVQAFSTSGALEDLSAADSGTPTS